jgi:hypothetical protein
MLLGWGYPMSRGNYYYARGWVGHGESNWSRGEIARFDDWGDSLVTSIMFLMTGVILQAFSAFADVNWLASTLPLFSSLIGVIGVLSMFNMPKKGLLYVGGWTFISVLLFAYKLINASEFLTDLIPIALIVYAFYKANSGAFGSGLGESGGYLT